MVALSTDKACNPINLYGATKLARQDLRGRQQPGRRHRHPLLRRALRQCRGLARLCRPLFQRLVAGGAAELPITDPRMTRFWISLDQGVDFVLSCLEMTRGGEVFVPKIGSMSMPDVAAALAPGLPTRTIGIRPGEKLHETMVSADDARMTTELADRYVIEPEFVEYPRTACSTRTACKQKSPDGFSLRQEHQRRMASTPRAWRPCSPAMADHSFLPYGHQVVIQGRRPSPPSRQQRSAPTDLTTGPRVEAFEQAFAETVGARHAVACANGTAALHLSMAALDLGPGDVVIVPAITAS